MKEIIQAHTQTGRSFFSILFKNISSSQHVKGLGGGEQFLFGSSEIQRWWTFVAYESLKDTLFH